MQTEDEKFREIISAMTKIAKADGKITEEEAEILESVHINLMLYDDYVEEALEDGIIDNEEKEVLAGMKQSILTEAFDIAQISDGVSDDELKLLELLLKKANNED
ncbi:MAG: hypothetical protein INQ03_10365 [Candidatus Heimdallarchaeota archaeon]|nr:hypothetical protein [Candidatus Heimdallarchaeota archaeon]